LNRKRKQRGVRPVRGGEEKRVLEVGSVSKEEERERSVKGRNFKCKGKGYSSGKGLQAKGEDVKDYRIWEEKLSGVSKQV